MSRILSLKSSAENTAIYNKTRLHQQEGIKGNSPVP
jgi:hypothetical protein